MIKFISCLHTKTGRHDIAEILLKVALNTINQIKSLIKTVVFLQPKENGIRFSILIQMSGNKFIYSHLKLQHVQNYIGFNLE